MDSRSYLERADACLETVVSWCEQFDADELDCSPADGVLTLEFAGRERFVLNRQAAAQQMWLAAGARAWHYRWDEARGAWLDDKDGHELLGRLEQAVAAQLGRSVPPLRR